MKENKNKRNLKDRKKEKYSKHEDINDKNGHKEIPEDNKTVSPLTFQEFTKKRFSCIAERLYLCVVNLYTHLPTSLISLEVVETMVATVDSLKSFQMC